MTRRRIILTALGALTVIAVVYAFAGRPSNDRDWEPNEAVLPSFDFRGDSVALRNVRNTSYRTADDYTPAYYDTTYDMKDLQRVWFGVVPFTGSNTMAHTFLSFEFTGPEVANPPSPEGRGGQGVRTGSRFVTVSVEARNERGEDYGPIKGLFRRYELMYVIADERDAIGLRAVHRRDAVYLYPIRTQRPEHARVLFLGMLAAAHQLVLSPRFYNTLTANCTSTIVRHVNTLVPRRVPFSYRWLLPGYADELAFDLGLIDTDLPRDSLRSHFGVSEAARLWADSANFSQGIRRSSPRRSGA